MQQIDGTCWVFIIRIESFSCKLLTSCFFYFLSTLKKPFFWQWYPSCDNICCYMMPPRFTIVLLLRGSIHLTNQTSATDVRTCSRDASPCWSPSHSVFGHRFLCLTGRFYNSGCFKRPFNTDWGHFALGDIQRLPKCVSLNSFGHATGPQDTFLIMEPKWYPEVLHQDPAASVLGATRCDIHILLPIKGRGCAELWDKLPPNQPGGLWGLWASEGFRSFHSLPSRFNQHCPLIWWIALISRMVKC